jgi:formyltetrahydrofolate synthetase
VALSRADYVVTESGFGADIGFEKFVHIKSRVSGVTPDAVVLVCTIRALKAHSGRYKIVAGKPLDPGLLVANADDVLAGCVNLRAQIANAAIYGRPVVVALNRFPSDHAEEIAVVKQVAAEAGAFATVESQVFAEGGAGGDALAAAVEQACSQPGEFRYLYDLSWSLTKKIETLTSTIYGASSVEYSSDARKQLERYEKQGYGNLPICMAKTQYSLSHDASKIGAPRDYAFPIREVRLAAGAGFIYPLAGDMRTMPGLPATPGAERIDIDAEGNTVGLS